MAFTEMVGANSNHGILPWQEFAPTPDYSLSPIRFSFYLEPKSHPCQNILPPLSSHLP